MRIRRKELDKVLKSFITKKGKQLFIKRGKLEESIDTVIRTFDNAYTKLSINEQDKVFLDIFAADSNKSRKIATYCIKDATDQMVIELTEKNKENYDNASSPSKDDFILITGDNFEIIERIGIISITESNWQMELNLVKWFGKEAKYDIRSWSSDYSKRSKGITLTKDELHHLYDILQIYLKNEKNHQKEVIVPEKCNIDHLCQKWDIISKRAPNQISKYISGSEIYLLSENRVVVIVKKGYFEKLVQETNKNLLTNFISNTVGQKISVDLVESNYI